MNFENGPNLGRKKKPPWSIKNGLWEPLANQGSCGATHAAIIGHVIFFGQNERASRAGKTNFFSRIGFFPTTPRINQANLSLKLRSRADETHIVVSGVRLAYVKPPFMCESEFVAQS